MIPTIRISAGLPARDLRLLQPIWITVEHRINAIPSGEIVLSTTGNALEISHNSEIDLCRPGSPISISIVEPQNVRLIFSGIVTEQSCDLTKESATLTLRIKHKLASLENTFRSQVFSDMTPSQVIHRLLHEHGIAFVETARMNSRAEQLIQFRCSDWHYVRRLMDENGVWLIPGPDKSTIALPKLDRRASRTLKQNNLGASGIDRDAGSLHEARWKFSNQSLPRALKMTAWDVSRQKTISAQASPQALGQDALNPQRQTPSSDSTWVVGTSTSVTQSQLSAMTDGALQRLQETAAQATFKVEGTTDYRLGETLGLSGFGRNFDGTGIVTAIAQTIGKAQWTTSISTGRQGLFGNIAPLPRMEGLHVGVVSDFKKDPNNLDRMRVRLSALGETNNVVWARLAMPFASKQSGFSFYPDPGDEVVVGFFDDDPNFPMIVGSMHNPLNKAPLPLTKENAVKGIVVREQGKKLLLTFDKDAGAANMTAGDDQIRLKAGIAIESRSAGGVAIKAKKIDLGN